MPASPSVHRVADREGHDPRYALDGSGITTEPVFRPCIPFRQGIAETVRQMGPTGAAPGPTEASRSCAASPACCPPVTQP
jgi:hypothetical protein